MSTCDKCHPYLRGCHLASAVVPLELTIRVETTGVYFHKHAVSASFNDGASRNLRTSSRGGLGSDRGRTWDFSALYGCPESGRLVITNQPSPRILRHHLFLPLSSLPLHTLSSPSSSYTTTPIRVRPPIASMLVTVVCASVRVRVQRKRIHSQEALMWCNTRLKPEKKYFLTFPVDGEPQVYTLVPCPQMH